MIAIVVGGHLLLVLVMANCNAEAAAWAIDVDCGDERFLIDFESKCLLELSSLQCMPFAFEMGYVTFQLI